MKIDDFLELLNEHTRYRREAVNLIASENCTSPLVRAALSSDLGHRYAADFYGGTKFIRKIISEANSLVRELFDVEYSLVSSLSGNLCDLALVFGLTKMGDKIMVVGSENEGGYPLDYELFGRRKLTFNFSTEEMNLLIEENIEAIKRNKPTLVIFGASFFPFPQPVKEITKEFGSEEAINFAYDGSHVLGLIAGKQFQDPLREGASVLVGSTHKSFPGPQGGLIVTTDAEKYKALSSMLEFDLTKGIRFVDNPHLHRIAALAIASLEMLAFGEDYAKQIVKNSKAMAKALDENGVPVRLKEKGYTESHQILIDTPSYEEGAVINAKAEQVGLIIDSGIRIGTSEITRLGMKEREAKEIGEILAGVFNDENPKELKRRVQNLTADFNKPVFCFNAFEAINW